MGRYLKIDFYRLVTSHQFYIGIVGMAVLYYLASFQFVFFDVGTPYICIKMSSVAIIAYAFCAVPFSGCYIEDEENHFWYLAVQKGSIKKYAWSKTLICFFGAVLTMMIGVALFALIMQTQVPLFLDDGIIIDLREADAFGFLLYHDTAFFYFICSAGLNGLLGGIFALLSAYLSLYEKNRLFTICAPIIGYYFIENFLTETLNLPDLADLEVIFSSDLSLFDNVFLDVSYAVVAAAAALIIIGILTVRKIEREIHGDKK